MNNYFQESISNDLHKEAKSLLRKIDSIVKICGTGHNSSWNTKTPPFIEIKEITSNKFLKTIYNIVTKICYSGFQDTFHDRTFLDFSIEKYKYFESARLLFSDNSSLFIFDWYIAMRIMLGAYGIPNVMDLSDKRVMNALSLFPGVYSPEEYIKLWHEAQSMPYPPFPNELVVDRLGTWVMKQYEISGFCEAEQGDYILDCGAYTGNTALYFASKIGKDGKCYSFEGLLSVFDKFNKNMKFSQQYKDIIHCEYTVLEDYIGLTSFTGEDLISSAHISNDGEKIQCTTIDHFVASNNLPRVDFIKMDIEGGEMGALRGAKETIEKHHPKMAISVYHKNDDLIVIPEFIQSLRPYDMRLKHSSLLLSETILFASPKKNQ